MSKRFWTADKGIPWSWGLVWNLKWFPVRQYIDVWIWRLLLRDSRDANLKEYFEGVDWTERAQDRVPLRTVVG
jgi:hypothetical protein